ncbi:MAG TPA: glycosyltransferase [Candidatus Paceibacterota bacterium]|nr:glycosyltransferase [Candidatus Paceibacterota bacterium]
MKLAIVHDWFIRPGGAERVLCSLHRLWPEAPIYFLVADRAAVRKYLPDATVRISGVGRVPLAARLYSMLAPVLPAAVESLDLSAFDMVLSNSVLFSKGIVVRPGTRHVSYCYSPSRPLWDRAVDYERRGPFSRLARHMLRTWDFAAAQRPDQFVAISRTAADRIDRYYRRDSIVLPPPTPLLPAGSADPDAAPYFLVVSRLVPHKRLAVIIDAFNRTRTRLVIAGSGPLERSLRRRAGPTVSFAGAVDDTRLAALYRNAIAVVMANDEDWGLTAVEAMAYGTPVLALRDGGATETVLEGVTGEFFDEPIMEAIVDGIKRLTSRLASYDREGIRRYAHQWSEERWAPRMRALIEPVA